MPQARVWRTSGFQGVPLTPLSRVYFNGLLITQAGIQGITYSVQQLNDGNPQTIVTPTPLVVANTVYNAAQGTPANPDPRWKGSSQGFNFAPTIPPSAFPTADDYWVACCFTPTSGFPFVQLIRATIITNLGILG
jgi:hypothetical protein